MSLLHTAVGIFTISNPIGNLPIYLSFTDGNRRKDRAIARSCAITFLISLMLATWLGSDLLGFFGISRAAFQVAGGLIVVLIGLSMLRSEPSKVHHDPASIERDQNSAVKGIVPRASLCWQARAHSQSSLPIPPLPAWVERLA